MCGGFYLWTFFPFMCFFFCAFVLIVFVAIYENDGVLPI